MGTFSSKRRNVAASSLCALVWAGVAAPSVAAPSNIYFTEMTAWTPAPGGPAHVYSANPDGSGKVQLTSTPGCRIDDVELDRTNGHVYYTTWCSGSAAAGSDEGIWRMNTDGTGLVQVVGDGQNNSSNLHASGMHAMSIDEVNGRIFWARHVSYASPAEISMMNLDGTGYAVLDTQGWFVSGVDFDPIANQVYWGNHGCCGSGGDLNRVNFDGTGATELVGKTADEGTGVAIDVGAGVVFYGRWGNFAPEAGGRITRYDVGSATTTVVFDDPSTGVTDLEVDPVDQRVWFVSHATGEIRSINYDGTDMVTEVSGLNLPFGLDLELPSAQCEASLDQCEVDLGQCQTDAAQCQTDLTEASGDLGVCQTDLGQCGASLDQANVSLGACQTDLGECGTSLDQVSASLGQCQTALSQTSSDLGQCQTDLAAASGDLATCSADLAAADAQLDDGDGDGIPNVSDGCADSGAVGVDAEGCSLQQFCGAIDASVPRGRRLCRKSDWGNDEPLMRWAGRDCHVERNGKGRADNLCVPMPGD